MTVAVVISSADSLVFFLFSLGNFWDLGLKELLRDGPDGFLYGVRGS
jgi:hypothetical protein